MSESCRFGLSLLVSSSSSVISLIHLPLLSALDRFLILDSNCSISLAFLTCYFLFPPRPPLISFEYLSTIYVIAYL